MITKQIGPTVSARLDKYLNRNEFWWNVRDFIYKWSGRDFLVYNIIGPIKHLIPWIPVILKDKDWDDSYLIKIIAFKLKRMRPSIQSHDGVIEFEKDIMDPAMPEDERKSIKHQLEYYYALCRCIELCDRISDDMIYYEEYDKMFIKHYGGLMDIKCHFGKIDPVTKLGTMNFEDIDTAVLPEKREIARKVNKRFNSLRYEEYHKNKDTKELFETMNKYIRGWWS